MPSAHATRDILSDDPASWVDEPCRNCGAPLEGPYCHSCGQRHRERLAAREIVSDMAGQLLQWESSVGRTLLGLTTAPGRVCREYVEGRRASYVNPFKYCLTAVALYFFWNRLLGYDPSDAVHQALGTADARTAALRIEGQRFVTTHFANVLFVVLPFFALVLTRLFRRSGRPFLEHYAFALFVVGHSFLVGLLFSLLGLVHPGLAVAGRLVFQAGYLTWAAIGFYRERPLLVAFKALVAQLAYFAAIILVVLLVMLPRIRAFVDQASSTSRTPQATTQTTDP